MQLEELVQLTDSIDCYERCMVWPINLDAHKGFQSLYG